MIRAVDDVSFTVGSGETIGLVGESGSGKSTTGRLLLRLLPPTSGRVFFEDHDLLALPAGEMKRLRQEMQIVFQDPYGSLNPRMTVGRILLEGLESRSLPTRSERETEVGRLLDLVGLRPSHRDRYPHEFSGGQRQRISIARALAVNPRFLVADEPVSALDVSIQAQVLNLLLSLQQQLGLALLFIAHDLAVVRHMSDRIAVMYHGKIVEMADNRSLYESPAHPYTRHLLEAIPRPVPRRRSDRPNSGSAGQEPSGETPAAPGSAAADQPGGCVYRSRCVHAVEICAQEPALRTIGAEHVVACHRAEELMHLREAHAE